MTYADVMVLPVRVFYLIMQNAEVIAGTKDYEKHKKDLSGEMDSPEDIRRTLKNIDG